MTTTYDKYINAKKAFFAKHNHDFEVHTSPMNEYDEYSKTYCFADGSQWFESMRPEYVKIETVVNFAKVKTTVKMFCTEFYNTDEFGSNRYYETF